MTSHRCTGNSALKIFVVAAAPLWTMACSAEDAPPASDDRAAVTTTGANDASNTMGGPTSGTTATSGQTNGSTTTGSTTTTAGTGGASTSAGSASTTGTSTTSAGSSTSPTGSSTTSGATGVGGSGGMGTTAAGTGTTGTMGGSGGTGTVAPGDPDPSPGCGMADPTECSPCMAHGRPYYIDMPNDYDPDQPYPVIFKYHPLGGTAQGARNMYLGPNDFEAIYVSQEGSDNGFPNQGGEDEQTTRDIMTDIEARLCVDRARYYATGFSYGGSMSYTAACNMSDKFRAIAAMAGAPISGANCTRQAPERPVAILGIHGEEDTALPITMAEPIVESWIEKNGCSGDAPQPSDIIDPECVKMTSALDAGAYQGCMEGYPVIWCPIPGYPHNIPTWSRAAIAKFFTQF